MPKQVQKMFFVSEIIASGLAFLNCLYQEENTCHRQAMCQELILSICISLRRIFSNSIAFTVINRYFKVDAV